MIKGQCLCGDVQYQYHGEIENSILCYCTTLCQSNLFLSYRFTPYHPLAFGSGDGGASSSTERRIFY